MERLFAYGTLEVPAVLEAVTGRRFPSLAARLPGFARRAVRGEVYPGLVPEAGAETLGRVYLELDAQTLAQLDRFEGALYRRSRVQVVSGQNRLDAWAYVVPEDRRHLLEPRAWSPERFRAHQLADFLAACRRFASEVPDARGAWREPRRREVPGLARLLARAFRDDPLHRWLLPAGRALERRSRRLFALLLRQGLRHAVVDRDRQGLGGVAVWRPPAAPVLSGWERFWFGTRYAWLVRRHASRIREGYARIERLHPESEHWHLSILGVDPALQGRGIGSALLRRGLERSDRDGLPAHLECSRPENLGFYARHGFEVVGEVELPEGPRIWAMARAPQV